MIEFIELKDIKDPDNITWYVLGKNKKVIKFSCIEEAKRQARKFGGLFVRALGEDFESTFFTVRVTEKRIQWLEDCKKHKHPEYLWERIDYTDGEKIIPASREQCEEAIGNMFWEGSFRRK